jgi:hypothetical protein
MSTLHALPAPCAKMELKTVFYQLSSNQCLGDVKCALNAADSSVNNFCTSTLSFCDGGWL